MNLRGDMLVRGLLDKTRARRIAWQHQTATQAFVAMVGNRVVRLAPNGLTLKLTVTGPAGELQAVGESAPRPGQADMVALAGGMPGFADISTPAIADLYQLLLNQATEQARIQQALDNQIDEFMKELAAI